MKLVARWRALKLLEAEVDGVGPVGDGRAHRVPVAGGGEELVRARGAAAESAAAGVVVIVAVVKGLGVYARGALHDHRHLSDVVRLPMTRFRVESWGWANRSRSMGMGDARLFRIA